MKMKIIIILLVILASFSVFSQVEDGLYFDQQTGILTIVNQGYELSTDTNLITENGEHFLITTHYVYLLNSEGAMVDVVKLGPADSIAPYPPLTNLSTAVKVFEAKSQPVINFKGYDLPDNTKQLLLKIKGIPVYSSGIKLNN